MFVVAVVAVVGFGIGFITAKDIPMLRTHSYSTDII